MPTNPRDALRQFPPQALATPLGQVCYRGAGRAAGVTHVLLHGIGSASSNWVFQLQAARERDDARVLAWDAPGYGNSAPVTATNPLARDYAQRLWAWLDALDMRAPIVLAGHSLGALMAASAAVLQPARVRQLVLLAPALGYGDAPAPERAHKLQARLDALQGLGPEGMAAARAPAMLSPDAAPELVACVREAMAQVNPAGYTQAAHLLADGTLLQDIAAVRCPITVASGDADTITPPESCARAARQAGVARLSLGPVGHACPLEAAAAVNRLLGLST